MGYGQTLVSIIMPAYNALEYLRRTLPAVKKSDYPFFELIVADDGSTDGSGEFSEKYADHVIRMKVRSAPAKARNQGAMLGKGSILLFIDADVEISPHTVSLIVETMKESPETAAVFGSYDEDPLCKNFFSQYKNLTHYFVHQNSSLEAGTFWAGCGAIRRTVFLESGGFPEKYRAAAIEDVELGYRLKEMGKRIKLLKELQVKHLKKWGLLSLLKSDIFYRAVPWTNLALKRGLPRDLNFTISGRISGAAACLFFLSLLFMWRWNFLALLSIALAGALFYLNQDLYKFFLKKRGFKFTSGAVLYHWFYFLYSSVTFVVAYTTYCFKSLFSRPGSAIE